MRKIDILVGDNTYGTALQFSKSLSRAMKKCGIKTRMFWVANGHFFKAFYEIINDPPDLTCSFSDISVNNQPLGDLWQIPHLSILIDPPIYFLHQFTTRCGYVSCVDEEDCVFVRNLNFSKVFFLPHAADSRWQAPVNKERPLEAVFFGTCIDYEAVARSWLNKERELLLAAADRVLSTSGLSIAQALIELGVNVIDLPRLHVEVDRYTRGKERIQLIRSLKEVHIWGEGPWRKYLSSAYKIHPPVSFTTTLQITKNSKIVLNSSPRFKKGAHERIFYALMCGAAVYSAENSYLKTELPEIFTCALGEWQAPDFIEREARTQTGQERVLKGHTWEARVLTLLDFFRNLV